MIRMTILRCLMTSAFCLTAGALLAAPPACPPMDWPYWRGPEMNGVSREKGIVDRWSTDENVLWMNEEAASRSTPIVMNGRLFVLTRDQPETKFEGEKVLCLDAATGEKLWENRFNVFLSDVPDTRVGWSSVVGDPTTDRVYALGVCGYFQCIDAKTGETIWSHSLSEEYGLLSTYGGRTNFPIIDDDLVIISAVIIGWGEMAKPTHRFIAFDKRNGQPVWLEGTRPLPEDTTYSAPVLGTVNGQSMMIFGSGDGSVHAFQPQTGKSIWTYEVSRRGINTSPLLVGDTVIGGHSEENIDDTKMGALFAIKATGSGNITQTGELWRQKQAFVGKASPMVIDGRVYSCEDTGTLLIHDLETGKEVATEKLGGPMRSSPLYVDGKLFVLTENGRWWTFKPSDDGVETIYRARLKIGSVNASPIVSHGKVYVTTTDGLFCIGNKDVEPSTDPIPDPAAATPVTADPEPTHVQIVPVESLLRSGASPQRQQFQVRLFNSNGQYLRTVPASEVKFAVTGPGQIDDAGKYSAPAEAVHAAVTVTAKIGDLEGSARIRVVPPLPWKFDFSDGEVPVTWVGARYRHIAADLDLLQELEAADYRTGQLYLYLLTGFVNTGAPAQTFDDSTPRQTWTELLRFLDLLTTVKTLEEGQAALDAALKTLQEKEVISGWEWSTWERGGVAEPKLVVKKGPRKITGNSVVVKIKTIPKGTRSQAWMGQTDLSNYTIQSDVMGMIKDEKMPDIGLIAQRYTIDMMGASQQLQIRTWPPQLRMAQTIPFTWEPKVWYTLKLKASVENGKAVLRGKAWKRGTPEPEEWMVEAVDDSPNLIGSPGLFGNAKDAEIFYDNLTVVPNED